MEKSKHLEIEKINSKCSNGWKVHYLSYVSNNQKYLYKQIKIDDNSYLEFLLDYNSNNQICLYIRKYEYLKGTDGLATSEGLGKNRILDQTKYNRKVFNKLINFTTKLTDEELLRINSITDVTKVVGIIESDNF